MHTVSDVGENFDRIVHSIQVDLIVINAVRYLPSAYETTLTKRANILRWSRNNYRVSTKKHICGHALSESLYFQR